MLPISRQLYKPYQTLIFVIMLSNDITQLTSGIQTK